MANQILAGAVFHAGQVIAGVDADNPPYVGPPPSYNLFRVGTEAPYTFELYNAANDSAAPTTFTSNNDTRQAENGRYLALGSRDGLVEVYDLLDLSAPPRVTNPADGDPSDTYWGFRVAMSSDNLFVSSLFGGKITVYDLSDMSIVNTITCPDAFDYRFADEIICNSTHLFVGQSSGREDPNDNMTEAGKVWVYNLSDFSVEHILYPINGEYGDQFGSTIKVSDTRLVVGAYGDDEANGYNQNIGAVYLYELSDLSGSVIKIDAPSGAQNWGRQVDITNTHLAVSTTNYNTPYSGGGIVNIYTISALSASLNPTYTMYSDQTYDGMVMKGFIDDADQIVVKEKISQSGPNTYAERIYSLSDLSTPLSELAVGTTFLGQIPPYVAPPAPLPSYDWSSASLSLTLSNQIDGSSKDFGRSLATSGDYHVVSQPQSYEVNVFDNSGNLVRTIPHPEGRTVHFFGGDTSVWVTGNKLLLSDSGSPEGSINSSGKAWLFDVTTGSILHTFLPETPRQMDRLGQVSAMSENYVALLYGQSESYQTAEDTAKVAIYDVSTGSLLRVISPAIWEANQTWGTYPGTITISGNYIAIAASTRGPSSGAVEIFDISTGNHLRTLENPNVFGTTNNDYFGKSLSSSGNYLAVGTAAEDSSLGNGRGVVYVYDVTDGSLLHTLSSSDTQSNSFGACVSMSGKHLAVSDYLTSSYFGVVYVYDVTDGSLVHTASNPTPETYDFMGKPVSMSGGTLLTVAKKGDPAEAYVWTAPLL